MSGKRTRRHVQNWGNDGQQAANAIAHAKPGVRRATVAIWRHVSRDRSAGWCYASMDDALAASAEKGRVRKGCEPWGTWSTPATFECPARGTGRVLELRIDRRRIRHRRLHAAAHRRGDPGTVRRDSGVQLGLEAAAGNGRERPTTHCQGPRAGRAPDPHLEAREAPGANTNAALRRHIIAFIDESGLSERPCCTTTWVLTGEMPILQYSFDRPVASPRRVHPALDAVPHELRRGVLTTGGAILTRRRCM